MPANRLLEPVRYGNRATDLWTTFNVVQERLVRGGTRYSGYIPVQPNAIFPTHLVRNVTRPIGNLAVSRTLNKELWSLAEQFAQN